MRAATPRLAVRASSLITGMSITISTPNPTASASSAVRPATNRRRNVYRAATSRWVPRPTSSMMPFIFCAPCETPMANTRKGTRTVKGSTSKPSRATRPSCQVTATTEQAITRSVLRQQRV